MSRIKAVLPLLLAVLVLLAPAAWAQTSTSPLPAVAMPSFG